jgi:hypothetical protein
MAFIKISENFEFLTLLDTARILAGKFKNTATLQEKFILLRLEAKINFKKLKMSENIVVPRYCSHFKCKSKHTDNILIFHMPKEPKIQAKWREFVKKSGKNISDTVKTLKLCEYHFERQNIDKTRSPSRLMPGSIPIYEDIRVKSF